MWPSNERSDVFATENARFPLPLRVDDLAHELPGPVAWEKCQDMVRTCVYPERCL